MSLQGNDALAVQVAAGMTTAALLTASFVNLRMTPHIFASARYGLYTKLVKHKRKIHRIRKKALLRPKVTQISLYNRCSMRVHIMVQF